MEGEARARRERRLGERRPLPLPPMPCPTVPTRHKFALVHTSETEALSRTAPAKNTTYVWPMICEPGWVEGEPKSADSRAALETFGLVHEHNEVTCFTSHVRWQKL